MRVEVSLNHSNRVPAFFIYSIFCIGTGVFKKIKIFCEKCNIFIDNFIVRTPIKVIISKKNKMGQPCSASNVYRILLGNAVEESR
jgi:hypothetical protein